MWNQSWEDIKHYMKTGFLGQPIFNLYHMFWGFHRFELWRPHLWWKDQVQHMIKFADHLVDAHEDERNDKDTHRTFYM